MASGSAAEPPKEDLPPDALSRMWQHGLHLDTMLFQRGNLFLVAESLLVVSFTSTLAVALAPGQGAPDRPFLAARVIAAFGLMLTMAWGYIGHRHLRYYRLHSARLCAHISEYRALRESWQMRGPSSLPLVTYCLPGLAGVMWVLLIIIVWR